MYLTYFLWSKKNANCIYRIKWETDPVMCKLPLISVIRIQKWLAWKNNGTLPIFGKGGKYKYSFEKHGSMQDVMKCEIFLVCEVSSALYKAKVGLRTPLGLCSPFECKTILDEDTGGKLPYSY